MFALTFTLSHLTVWCFGQTALFFLLWVKEALVYLPTAFSVVALRPLSPIRQAQYVQVFRLKPAPNCTLFAGLGSTNKSAISLLLALTSSPCLLRLSFYPNLSGRCGRNILLSPVLSGYTMGSRTLVSPGERRG